MGLNLAPVRSEAAQNRQVTKWKVSNLLWVAPSMTMTCLLQVLLAGEGAGAGEGVVPIRAHPLPWQRDRPSLICADNE